MEGGESWGGVQLRRHGVWGDVCLDAPPESDAEATVACRMLGYTGGRAWAGYQSKGYPYQMPRYSNIVHLINLDDFLLAFY